MDLYSYAKAAFASLSDVSRVPFYRRLYEEFQFVPGYTWTRNGEWESHGSRGPRDVSLPGFSPSLSHSLSDLPLPNLVHVHVCFTSSSVLPLPHTRCIRSSFPCSGRRSAFPSVTLVGASPSVSHDRGPRACDWQFTSRSRSDWHVASCQRIWGVSKLIFAHFLLIFL